MDNSMNREAIFSDGTKYYVNPAEPMEYDRVTIKLRTGREDIDHAMLILPDGILTMTCISQDFYFDYYEAVFSIGREPVHYFFLVQKGAQILYYNQEGVVERAEEAYHFRLFPGFRTPDWAKGAVFYQIFVDRFRDGDVSNNVVTGEYSYIGEQAQQVDDWNKPPHTDGIREFYGGDLKGVLDKLDYLQELGIEALYLNPIFVSPSNHKYDIQDYDYVDPHYTVIQKDGGDVLAPGDLDNSHATKYQQRVTNKENLQASNEYFAHFVQEVHKRGMKVILDGVFNHCGSFHKWMDKERIYENQYGYEKGAYVAKESPYHDYFEFAPDGQWPYNPRYDGWWGHDTLPKINYEKSLDVFAYIMRIGKKWLMPPYDVDGWRLDVAADVGHSMDFNHHFWQEFRKSVKETNPKALILAEHYGDVRPWVSGGEWDSVMNYDAFMEPITWFLTGMEKHSDAYRSDLRGNAQAFWNAMKKYAVRLPFQSAQVAMNELSNHDHSRFLTRTNGVVGRLHVYGPEAATQGVNQAIMMAAVVFQMTWVGAPTVYYGDEAGVGGWTDPDNRRTYPWGLEDKSLIWCHKEMIRIHKDYKAFSFGSTIHLYSDYNLISYGRFDPDDQIAVAIYIGDVGREVRLPVWKMGVEDGQSMVRLCRSDLLGFSINTEIRTVTNGELVLYMEPQSTVVYKSYERR